MGDTMATGIARLTIDLPKKDHKMIKTAATLMDLSMKDLVLLSVDAYLHRKPNRVTEKALRQVKTGKGIKKFANISDMLDDLKS
jgi:hypothetical protein